MHTCRMGAWAVLVVVACAGVTHGAVESPGARQTPRPPSEPSFPGLLGLPGLPGLPLGIPSTDSALHAAPGHCQPLQVAECEGALPYTSVGLPNLLGHRSQTMAATLLAILRPALASRCSPDLRRLLCTVLLPPCRTALHQRLPCRGVCASVRAGCESLMMAHGVLWPSSLNCDLLPTADQGCVGPPAASPPADTTPHPTTQRHGSTPTPSPSPTTGHASPRTTTTPPRATTLSSATTPPRATTQSGPHSSKCEPLTLPMCKGLPYNTTIMPNLLNHHSQEEAGMEVHQFFPILEVQCSPDLHFFLCSLYVPVCTILDRPLPPCRHLCLSAKDGCEDLMNKFGFQWPESLDCNKFPAGPNELCVEGNNTSPNVH